MPVSRWDFCTSFCAVPTKSYMPNNILLPVIEFQTSFDLSVSHLPDNIYLEKKMNFLGK